MTKAKNRSKAAIRQSLKESVKQKDKSYSSYGTSIDRLGVFINFLEEKYPGTKISDIDREMVIDFGKSLTKYKPSYAQNLISSINSFMRSLRYGAWKSVSPTRDCGIPRRGNIRRTAPTGLDTAKFSDAMIELELNNLHRGQIVCRAALSFGLRKKEASLLNYKLALFEAEREGCITINWGTKGGRKRKVPLTNKDAQLKILREGAKNQGDHFSIIPSNLSWKKFCQTELRKALKILKKNSIESFKDLRASYACNRYFELTGYPPPVLEGPLVNKDIDLKAREMISRELGHNRVNITNSYLGKHNYVYKK